MGFPQPLPGPHIRIEVGGTGWEEEVTIFVPNNHFLNRIILRFNVRCSGLKSFKLKIVFNILIKHVLVVILKVL